MDDFADNFDGGGFENEVNPFSEDDLRQIQAIEDEAMEDYELCNYFKDNPFSNEELLWSFNVECDEMIYNFENQIGFGMEQPAVDLPYILEERHRRFNQRFQAEEISYSAKINPSQIPLQYKDSILSTAFDFLKMLLSALLEEATKNLNEHDFARFCFFSDNLDRPISTCLQAVKDITVESMLALIMKVLQSKDNIPLDDPTFKIDVITLRNPRGGGKRKLANIDIDCLKKRSIVTIPRNEDNLCCSRAIVTAKAYMENNPQINSIRDGRRAMQKRMAEKLHQDSGVPVGPCGYAEIRKFEDFLNIQIHVVSSDNFNKVAYKGPNRNDKIFLYFHNQHYDVIKSMKAFLGCSYYCQDCDKGFDHVERHKCNVRCNVCFSYECREAIPQKCTFCNRRCKSDDCFQRHRALNGKQSSYCNQFYECSSCEKFLCRKNRPADLHRCGEQYCLSCKDYYLTEHLCFLKKLEPKKRNDSFIFFDFETDQESSEHIVNFAMAMYSTGEEFVFKGYNALEDFCKFLFSPQHKGYTAIAHNMRGFDGQFVLAYLLQQGLKPLVIPNGSKLMKIELPSLKMKVIDSFNFLPMSLSKFPKTFGLTELCKGYFPHYFNIRDNQRYVGSVPDAKYYTAFLRNQKLYLRYYLYTEVVFGMGLFLQNKKSLPLESAD